tara:strand:+ start:653 stop:1219 length:567 start_codon:yes stop_codon:yes gene_type:complete
MNGLRQIIRGLLLEIRREDFSNTYDTARRAHSGYYRRSGEEYFEHPKAVRNIIRRYYPKDYAAQLVALLHDTIEDFQKGQGFDSLAALQTQITSGINDPILKNHVIDTVKLLTHDSKISYEDYFNLIKNNPTAIRVKLADIEHNLSTAPSPSQIEKYFKAIDAILKNQKAFPDISNQQIDSLKRLRFT